MLLSIVQSDRERMCFRYAICKASAITPTAAQRVYGFEHMSTHVENVENTLSKVCEAISDLASIEDKALLQSFGVEGAISSSSESEEESATENVGGGDSGVSEHVFDTPDDLKTLLHKCDLNW